MSLLDQLCDRIIWFDDGIIKEEGKPRIVDPHYMEYMSEKLGENNKKQKTKEISKEKKIGNSSQKEKVKERKIQVEKKEDKKRWGSKEATMERVRVVDTIGSVKDSFYNTDEILIIIEYKTICKIEDAVIGIAIYRDDQTYIYGSNTLIDYSEPTELKSSGIIQLKIHNLPVVAGNYTIDLAFHKPDGFNYDFWREVCTINVKNKLNEVGIVSVPHEWIIE